MEKHTSVDDYIKNAPKEIQSILQTLRQTIKKAVPQATEKISYGMPFYEYGGTGYKGRLIYFGLFKKHIGIFIPPSLGKNLGDIEKYRATKSAFHFPTDKPIPFGVIAKTIKKLVVNKKLK